MFRRRCVVAVRVPEEPIRRLQQERLAHLEWMQLDTKAPRIEVRRFDCLSSEDDVALVTRAMDRALGPRFDVSVSGLLFTPTPKKARCAVAGVKLGKRQLQKLSDDLSAHYALSVRFTALPHPYVPVVALGCFSCVKTPNMIAKQEELSFVADIVDFEASELLLVDDDTDEVLHRAPLRDRV